MQVHPNHYIKNINNTLDFIDQNLEQTFTLEELSQQAHFSKYHFHRLFQTIVGEPPFQYILRLRLEKSANMLVNYPNKKLAEIAVQCGFSDLSVFSRNFRKHFGVSPSVYKKETLVNSNKRQIKSNIQPIHSLNAPYFCPESKTIKWTSPMEIIKHIEVKTLNTIAVAYNRNLGPYQGNNSLYQKHRGELFAWAASKELIGNPNFKYIILYHDNPNVTLNNTQRMSLCVTIPENTETSGTIGKMDISGGKYLVCQCELSVKDFPKVWEWIYGHWFPNNTYIPDDKPYFECYLEQPKGAIFKVEFCIPVKMRD